MAKFCGKCGTRLNEETGKCPSCDTQQNPFNTPLTPELELSKEPKKNIKTSRSHHVGLKVFVGLLAGIGLVGIVLGILGFYGVIEIPMPHYIANAKNQMLMEEERSKSLRGTVSSDYSPLNHEYISEAEADISVNLQAQLEVAEPNIDLETLIDGYWENNVDVLYLYKFKEDGTAFSYEVDPNLPLQEDALHPSQMFLYELRNHHLELTSMDGGTIEVSFAKNSEDRDWIDNTMYLRRSQYTGGVPDYFSDNIIDTANMSWELDKGVLTISGYGEMPDLQDFESQPWANERMNITSIIVGEGITSIGDMSFRNLLNVTKVSLPNSLTRIGKDAFFYTKLETVTFPENLVSIGAGAFTNLVTLTGELRLPDSITDIGDAAFYGCSGFNGELRLPASICSIGEMAFADCSGFTGNLIIPGGVETVAEGAFSNCSQLETLVLDDGVKVVEQNAFYSCSQLVSLDLPASLEEVESTSFNKCWNVETINCHGSTSFDGYRYLPKDAVVNTD